MSSSDIHQPSSTDPTAIISAWQAADTWAAFSAEVEGDGRSIIFRSYPWRPGDLKRLALSLILLILAAILLYTALQSVDVVARSVSAVFGLTMLAGVIGNTYLSLRVIEWQAQAGQLTRRSSVFGLALGTTVYTTGDISRIGRDQQGMHAVFVEFGTLPIVEHVDDEALLAQLQCLYTDILDGRPK